jgi:hypothetical protein
MINQREIECRRTYRKWLAARLEEALDDVYMTKYDNEYILAQFDADTEALGLAAEPKEAR